MSRIGKKPIALPKGVTVKIEGNTVAVQGPKGKLDMQVPAGIKVEQQVDRATELDPVQPHRQGQQLVSRPLLHSRRNGAQTDRTQTPQNPSSPRRGTKRQGTERRTAGPSGLRTITSSRCIPRLPTGTTSRPRGSSCS